MSQASSLTRAASTQPSTVRWTGRAARARFERADVNCDPWSLADDLGLASELDRLKTMIDTWLGQSDPEVAGMLRYQLGSPSKYFRPLTIFAAYQAVMESDCPAPDRLIRVAAAVELFHNYATVLDDIIDRDRTRRGKLSLHCRFGTLPALMASAYFAFAAAEFIADDEFTTRVFTDLGKRIAAVECRQWRLRATPFGLETWREIAGEDTGGMFAACATVATRDDRLSRFGCLLGILYHGCDDVADIRGTRALGGHSDRDITDRILTLPAAIATADPLTAELFANDDRAKDQQLAQRLMSAIPRAERELDALASKAEAEARAHAPRPRPLVALVRATRALAAA